MTVIERKVTLVLSSGRACAFRIETDASFIACDLVGCGRWENTGLSP